jgi:hypothetical protein
VEGAFVCGLRLRLDLTVMGIVATVPVCMRMEQGRQAEVTPVPVCFGLAVLLNPDLNRHMLLHRRWALSHHALQMKGFTVVLVMVVHMVAPFPRARQACWHVANDVHLHAFFPEGLHGRGVDGMKRGFLAQIVGLCKGRLIRNDASFMLDRLLVLLVLPMR